MKLIQTASKQNCNSSVLISGAVCVNQLPISLCVQGAFFILNQQYINPTYTFYFIVLFCCDWKIHTLFTSALCSDVFITAHCGHCSCQATYLNLSVRVIMPQLWPVTFSPHGSFPAFRVGKLQHFFSQAIRVEMLKMNLRGIRSTNNSWHRSYYDKFRLETSKSILKDLITFTTLATNTHSLDSGFYHSWLSKLPKVSFIRQS